MPTKPVDRRVRRTRTALANALLALLQTEEYETITIQQITDTADLNRATFYLHYGSKEDLLTDSLESMFDELVTEIESASAEDPIWLDNTAEVALFNHIAEHAPLYKVLLSERGQGYVIYRIIDYIAAYGQAQAMRHLPFDFTTSLPNELISYHVAGSLFGLVSWWVRNDMPYTPQYMADAAQQLCNQGTLSLFESLSANPAETPNP